MYGWEILWNESECRASELVSNSISLCDMTMNIFIYNDMDRNSHHKSYAMWPRNMQQIIACKYIRIRMHICANVFLFPYSTDDGLKLLSHEMTRDKKYIRHQV